jgi:glycerol-3-phosphate dehydrogenase (NAD(P)+)
MKIIVIGAGAWGTALAVSAAKREPAGKLWPSAAVAPFAEPAAAARSVSTQTVTLWARNAAQVAAMQTSRENARYLPGIVLPQTLLTSAAPLPHLTADLTAADLVIVATPMAALRGSLQQIRHCKAPVAWLCKGFEAAQSQPGLNADPGQKGEAFGLLGHELQAQAAPELIAGVLSGPSFAMEVARGQPTALVASSSHAVVRQRLVDAFHSAHLRVYANDDIAGVEVGGAVKNVLAIATGLCDGLNLGLNARAALITRGLSEMTRFGVALGAKPDTFMGLSGLGDLVLTATGDLSRNRKVGLLLAQGKTLQQAVDSLGHVAEGVYCARTVVQRAQSLGVDMPIAKAVVALLDGLLSPADAVAALMGREAREEA